MARRDRRSADGLLLKYQKILTEYRLT